MNERDYLTQHDTSLLYSYKNLIWRGKMDYFINDSQNRIDQAKEQLANGGLTPEEENALKERVINFSRLKEFFIQINKDLHNNEVCENVEMMM